VTLDPRVAMLGAVALMAGCGAGGYGSDVKGFTQQASSPAAQELLRSIATYRTTKDRALACSLITARFLKARFEGKPEVCRAVASQANHDLPKSAKVESLAGDTAKVRVQETTPVRSIYVMRREGGTWKIDDIVEAP
jgi:hypothetical protein